MIQSARTSTIESWPANEEIAGTLSETAELLEAQAANPFRVRAYRNAAETIRGLPRSVAQVLRSEGVGGLIRLPTVARLERRHGSPRLV